MHTYSIDKDVRDKVIKSIFIISVILSSVLTLILEQHISTVMSWLHNYDLFVEVINLCDKFGVTTNFIGIPFLYVLLYWLFDNYLWKWEPIRKKLNVPNLKGKWEGTLTSTTYQETIKMRLDIEQTWSKISFVSTFPKSRSESNTASIFIERDGIVKVGFGFINHSRELSHQYDGYNIIDIDDVTHLFGRYFNNRDNTNDGHRGGNIGTFTLSKVS